MMPERLEAAARHLAEEVEGLRKDVQDETHARHLENATLRRRNRISFVLIGLLALGGCAVFVNFRNDQRDQCRAITQNRDLLDAVVHVAYSDGGDGLDLSALPAYAGLDDATQAWVDQLQAAIGGSDEPDPGDSDGDGVPDEINVLLTGPACG